MTTNDTAAINALHAAEIWLQRIGAPPYAMVVVGVHPQATIGAWLPGMVNVATMPIDDAGAEVCEAAAPVVQEGISRLSLSERETVGTAVADGGRLQLVVLPLLGELRLRVLHQGREVEVIRARLPVVA